MSREDQHMLTGFAITAGSILGLLLLVYPPARVLPGFVRSWRQIRALPERPPLPAAGQRGQGDVQPIGD